MHTYGLGLLTGKQKIKMSRAQTIICTKKQKKKKAKINSDLSLMFACGRLKYFYGYHYQAQALFSQLKELARPQLMSGLHINKSNCSIC